MISREVLYDADIPVAEAAITASGRHSFLLLLMALMKVSMFCSVLLLDAFLFVLGRA